MNLIAKKDTFIFPKKGRNRFIKQGTIAKVDRIEENGSLIDCVVGQKRFTIWPEAWNVDGNHQVSENKNQ